MSARSSSCSLQTEQLGVIIRANALQGPQHSVFVVLPSTRGKNVTIQRQHLTLVMKYQMVVEGYRG